MKKEIEILVPVLDTKERALAALARFDSHGMKRTHDVYVADALRPNLNPEANGRLRECCRLREKDGKAFLAYKVDHFGAGDAWQYSDEHEVAVSDFASAMGILTHLGLEVLVEISSEKYVFIAGPYEVVLEDVQNLGLFMEVEVIEPAEEADADAERGEIRAFIGKLGIRVGEELNAGKPELLLAKRAKQNA